jgi:hypothetical protein
MNYVEIPPINPYHPDWHEFCKVTDDRMIGRGEMRGDCGWTDRSRSPAERMKSGA